jgi:hypothetical protein
MNDARADRIAARATAFGCGLMAFMITWLVAARISERMMVPPDSAYLAMGVALIAGAAVTKLLTRRLVDTVNQDAPPRSVTSRSASLS